MAPVIPRLNDHEIPGVLKAAKERGACRAGYTILRLPYGVKDIFKAWLDEHIPRAARRRILGRVREMRGGKLNDSASAARMRGEGLVAEQIAQLFKVAAAREGLDKAWPPLSVAAFRNPRGEQLSYFNGLSALAGASQIRLCQSSSGSSRVERRV